MNLNRKISIFLMAVITIFTVGCSIGDSNKGKVNIAYTIDKYDQVLLDVNFDVEPLPSLTERSKLKINITPRISDLDIQMNFITENYYKLIPPEPIEAHIFHEQISSFEKEIEFTRSGPTGIVVIFTVILPNKSSFKKTLHIYFYIPEINREEGAKLATSKSNIPRVSKYPTEAHRTDIFLDN